MFSKKTTKIDEIFNVDLTLCSKRQIDGEDFLSFCGLFVEIQMSKKMVWQSLNRFEWIFENQIERKYKPFPDVVQTENKTFHKQRT